MCAFRLCIFRGSCGVDRLIMARARSCHGRVMLTQMFCFSGNKHCLISWDGQDKKNATVRVSDLSSNGTFVSLLPSLHCSLSIILICGFRVVHRSMARKSERIGTGSCERAMRSRLGRRSRSLGHQRTIVSARHTPTWAFPPWLDFFLPEITQKLRKKARSFSTDLDRNA